MNNLDIPKVLQTIDTTIEELKVGITSAELSVKAKKGISKELEKTIRLALKIKLKSQQEQIENIIKALDDGQEIDLVELQQTANQLNKVLSVIKTKAA